MSRLSTPARDDVPEASKPILGAVDKQLGIVPDMYRLMALTRLHQLRGLGDAKVLKSLGRSSKGRHYRR
jgi:hypothetical protein